MHNVMMIAPSKSVKGGITTVVKGLMNSELEDKYCFIHIASHVDGSRFRKLVAAVTGIIKMFFVLLFRKIDIVHIHGSDIISSSRKFFFFKLAKGFRRKVIYHFHGASFAEQYAVSPPVVRKTIKKLFEQADHTICLSESWKETIIRIAPRAKVTVIPNGVKLPQMNKSKKTQNDIVQLTFLGLIGSRKGVFDLIEGIKQLISEGYSLQLFVGGNGKVEKLCEKIKQNNLSRHIHYLGWINEDQRDRLLRQTDIFVLPSYGEGMPMSILEAMSYGIPIVSTRVGGIPEMVPHGKCGLLILPGDIEALIKAIRYLMRHTEVRKAFGEAARKKVKDVYSLRAVSKQLDAIYSQLLFPVI